MTTLELINPATAEPFQTIPAATVEQVDDAVALAASAQRGWSLLAPAARAEHLRQFAVTVKAHAEELAQLEVLNSGHPIGNARWEANHVVDVLTYYSAAPERMIGKQIPVAGGIDVTFLEPYGVVGVIVPWNFPMTIAAWGFAPALAAGNAVIVKPAEWTPLTALRLAELALEAGLPPGLFQVLAGEGAVVGERLVSHPGVRKIVFTGSTATGSRVMSLAARQVKPVTLELGGKSANIIFADADLEKAAASAPGAVFDNSGQDCCARSRILVQRSVYDRFLELLEPAVKAVTVGLPGDESTEMGPLVARAHYDKVASYVPDDRQVAFRGTAPDGPGFWFAPTVLIPDSRDDRICSEEIFGPVVAVTSFDGYDDAISIANDTLYGLGAGVWSRNGNTAYRAGRDIQAGRVWVNNYHAYPAGAAFGGYKSSGIGRENNRLALDHYQQTKNLLVSYSDSALGFF